MAFISSKKLGDHSLIEFNGRNKMVVASHSRAASSETNTRITMKHLPRQWMLRCHKKRKRWIQKLPLATSTSTVRRPTAHLHTNLLRLLQIHRSIIQTSVRSEQRAKTENALAGIHLLLNKPSRNASSGQTAPTSIAFSNIQPCRHAGTGVIARHQTVNSHIARSNASLTHV